MARTDQSQTRKKWTGDDIRRLKKIYPDRSDTQVAGELGRTIRSVRAAASAFGLSKSKNIFNR